MFDTHCHLTFEQFRGRVAQVLADAAAEGVRGAITVCTTTDSAAEGLALATEHGQVWCTAGHHPLHADQAPEWSALDEVAAHERCVAWGELGLDNHYDHPPRSVQDRVLERQLAYIEERTRGGLSMPVVVHCRKAFDDVLSALRATDLDSSRFVFHCFTGDRDDARAVLDFGAWISFTGVVTFKNAREVADAAAYVPEDRIMVETDAPFLSPAPVRSMFPNEPRNVVHVARFIAERRNVDPSSFERRLDANAERFFNIQLPPPEP